MPIQRCLTCWTEPHASSLRETTVVLNVQRSALPLSMIISLLLLSVNLLFVCMLFVVVVGLLHSVPTDTATMTNCMFIHSTDEQLLSNMYLVFCRNDSVKDLPAPNLRTEHKPCPAADQCRSSQLLGELAPVTSLP